MPVDLPESLVRRDGDDLLIPLGSVRERALVAMLGAATGAMGGMVLGLCLAVLVFGVVGFALRIVGVGYWAITWLSLASWLAVTLGFAGLIGWSAAKTVDLRVSKAGVSTGSDSFVSPKAVRIDGDPGHIEVRISRHVLRLSIEPENTPDSWTRSRVLALADAIAERTGAVVDDQTDPVAWAEWEESPRVRLQWVFRRRIATSREAWGGPYAEPPVAPESAAQGLDGVSIQLGRSHPLVLRVDGMEVHAGEDGIPLDRIDALEVEIEPVPPGGRRFHGRILLLTEDAILPLHPWVVFEPGVGEPGHLLWFAGEIRRAMHARRAGDGGGSEEDVPEALARLRGAPAQRE